MKKADRIKRHFNICWKLGGSFFLPLSESSILPLGSEYEGRMRSVLDEKRKLQNNLIGELSAFSPKQLEENFDFDGTPLSQQGKELHRQYAQLIDDRFGKLKLWYKVPLFQTKGLADFDYWAKSEFLSIDEVVWLSLGFEPAPELIDAAGQYDKEGNLRKHDDIAINIARHRELIRRRFDPDNRREKPCLIELNEWIENTGLRVHPEFKQIIANRVKPKSQDATLQPTATQVSGVDGREKLSMSKLLAAMAIDAYGFDPRARRSKIPNEIQGIADRMGLDLSANTIRKYLNQGSELIPEDWKPE